MMVPFTLWVCSLLLAGASCLEISADPEKICHHVKTPLSEEQFVTLKSVPGRIKRSSEHSLRIKVYYHSSINELSSRKKRILQNQVVPNAVKHWERVLHVRRSTGNIILNRKCKDNQFFIGPDDISEQFCKEKCVLTKCGEFQVPKDHLNGCRTCDRYGRNCKNETESGPGVNGADFVLYVSSLQTKQCGEIIGSEAETVAYAAHCQQESEFDRPIAGHTNVCPLAIMDDKDEIDSLTNTIKHELLHALGFSSSLFAFWRDENGLPRTPRNADGKPPINYRLAVRQWSNNTIRQVKREWKVRGGAVDRKVHLMVTPKVTEEARRHFGCPTLEGAELEDQGGDGTALTHWEKRIFQNEAMTGTVHTQNPVYSRVTFALMEDSGWYLPNYDLAQDIPWGRGAGCEFATRSCKEIMDKAYSDGTDSPFCENLMHKSPTTSCTLDRKAVGSCNLILYSKRIPRVYQNFEWVNGVSESDLTRVGSSVTLADYCPYIQEFTWKSNGKTKSRGTICTDQKNQPGTNSNYALESYGVGSLCFDQASTWDQKTCTLLKEWKRYGGGCYRYTCSSGSLFMIVRNVTFECEKPYQIHDISLKNGDWLHTGSLSCPSCEEICGPGYCKPKKKSSSSKNIPYKETIDEDCSTNSPSNSLMGLFKHFGLDLFS